MVYSGRAQMTHPCDFRTTTPPRQQPLTRIYNAQPLGRNVGLAQQPSCDVDPVDATTDDQQYTFAGGGGCWGPLIGCPASPCTVGFVKPVNPGHFKNKFCPNCRAHGLGCGSR